MSSYSYQTIRLSRGRHDSPHEGACVMELASMLAGEPFSDRPQSVCPVIASFLRTYNDWIGDEERQRLRACASTAVGSVADRAVRTARRQHLMVWATELWRQRSRWGRLGAWWHERTYNFPSQSVGTRAGRAAARYADHAEVTRLIEELTAICELPAPSIETRAPADAGNRGAPLIATR